MSALQLSRTDQVWTLNLGSGENLIDDQAIKDWNAALDSIEATPGNGALLIVSEDPKFWCNGINLQFIAANGGVPFLIKEFVPRLDALLLRLALFPLPTIACLNGHAYAGGALLAAACDFRTMRADRGRFCFPEVNIKLPLSVVMTEIVRLLPNPHVAWQMAATGLALGGEEAARAGLVEAALSSEQLLPDALARATELAGKDRECYSIIKRNWRGHLRALQV